MNQSMTLTEAMAQTTSVSLGIEARCIRRKDRRGRVWYLISLRDSLFLVRQDRSGVLKVSHQFASKWQDWYPQTPDDAAREAEILSTPEGLAFRNRMLGIVLGPLPDAMIPDYLPEGL